MKYLVLRPFTTFGKYITKGTILDESEIRSPRLRLSEGKIIPVSNAVSSSELSGEDKSTVELDGAPLQAVNEDPDKGTVQEPEQKKPLFTFAIKPKAQ